jgi:hypothetical protein
MFKATPRYSFAKLKTIVRTEPVAQTYLSPTAVMELKLVYRALRKISEWTVGGFYEEVHVDGGEHVPKDGPLIVCVCFVLVLGLARL